MPSVAQHACIYNVEALCRVQNIIYAPMDRPSRHGTPNRGCLAVAAIAAQREDGRPVVPGWQREGGSASAGGYSAAIMRRRYIDTVRPGGSKMLYRLGLSGRWAVDLPLDWFGAACSHAHVPCHASDAEAHYSSLAAVAVMKLLKGRFSHYFGVTCEVRSMPCPTTV